MAAEPGSWTDLTRIGRQSERSRPTQRDSTAPATRGDESGIGGAIGNLTSHCIHSHTTHSPGGACCTNQPKKCAMLVFVTQQQEASIAFARVLVSRILV